MISVLIPSFNDSQFLTFSICSALEVKNVLEVIVVDDNSSDNTRILVKNLMKKNNKIKYYKNNKNVGSGLSYIRALNEAKYNFVLMLNSDDFFIPNGIDKLYNFAIKNNLEVAYGKMAIKKDNGIHKFNHPGYWKNDYCNSRDELTDLQIFDMYPPSFGTIIKKEILDGFYNEKYYEKLLAEYGGEFKAHDYDLIVNLASKKKKIGFLNEFVCVWCPKTESQSGEKYFTTGEAAYESAFLFNRYCKSEKFSYETRFKIYKRISEKLSFAKNNTQGSQSIISKHYEKFLEEINIKSKEDHMNLRSA